MLIEEISLFIREREKVSFEEICCRFAHEPSAMKGILTVLEAKGFISEEKKTVVCGGCSKECVGTEPIVYKWVKKD